jgi:16S rRNA (cytosine967-C5)-methyltransferase
MNHSARWIAVDILNKIEDSGGYAERLLDEALSGTALAALSDRGLLTELVYGTLRMRGRLDWIIRQLYQRDAVSLETGVRNILRTGLYQLSFTDRIPPFAAVNEAVNLAQDCAPAASGLINAILRNYLRKRNAITWPDMGKDPETAIAVLHSHPLWLVRRLLARFGREETIEICRANNAIAPVTLRVNTLKGSRGEAIAALVTEGIAAQPASFSADGITVTSSAAGLREMQFYREGLDRKSVV